MDSVGSAPQDLQVGSDVEFVLYNKVVARGIIDTIGGRFGNATKWGKILIGAGKASITVKDVVVPETRPTFGYTDPNNDDLSWDKKEVCLGNLRDRYQNAKTDLLLVVNTSALRISVGDDDTPIELSTEENVETSRSESPSTCPEENTTVEGIASDVTGERPEVDDNDENAANTAIEELDDDDEDEDEDVLKVEFEVFSYRQTDTVISVYMVRYRYIINNQVKTG